MNKSLALVFALTLLAVPAAAQVRKHEAPEQGYRLTIPRGFEIVPTEPNERQVLAKFTGRIEFRNKVLREEVNCTILVVRIAKNRGPTTGAGATPEQPADSADKTLREMAIERLNGATTIEDFLSRRGFENKLEPLNLPKPLKLKSGEPVVVQQVMDDTWDRLGESQRVPVVRSLTAEDGTEIFGLVGLGPAIAPFDQVLEDMLRSLERTVLGTIDTGVDYDKKDLGNKDFREAVRRKLVKGWEAYDTENFIFVTNSRNQKLIQDMLVDLELMRKVYVERFPPVASIDAISTVRYCETYDDYKAYGGPPGTGGYWNHVDEELVLADVRTMDPAILKANPNLRKIEPADILYHEAMHQYFFYANGQLSPASWFNEGYGEYFGGTVTDRRKNSVARIEKNRFRLAWIKQSQRAGGWPDLRSMLKMTQGEFYSSSSLQNYAFSWAFCSFLEELRRDDKARPEWQAIPDEYLKHLRRLTEEQYKKLGADPKDKKWLSLFEVEIQRAAFDATFSSIDLLALEQAWVAAMKKWR